ncbi:MAG: FAD-dependent oxidoreductase [Chthoniobacterales bacterium]|nr:FAD-dependent oxidoreductase [Chthoniobacterales bacterium]
MKPPHIAVIGTGISGLAASYFLSRHGKVTLFEKENRIGGHSHTVFVDEEKNSHSTISIPIDTGFMVYNEVTYPLLTRLFQELEVVTEPTMMSFSVQHRGDNLEYNGTSLELLFVQRQNLLRPRYWKMLAQIARFHREGLAELINPKYENLSLSDYVLKCGYGDDFFNWYLSPMAAAVWSSPPEKIKEFSAHSLLRFWHNHGFLGRDTHHPWRTVTGGSCQYIEKLTRSFQDCIEKEATIKNIMTVPQGVQINFADGKSSLFDKVVIATHPDQALQLLSSPTALEKDLLSSFRYQNNAVILHTDPQFMPKRPRCWASWNYRIDINHDKTQHHSTHYWMNSLQKVSNQHDYFVSLNPHVLPSKNSIKKQLQYEHPLFDLKAVAAQGRLSELRREGLQTHRYFCGAWQRYGFHEDGLLSAVEACKAILGHDPWQKR